MYKLIACDLDETLLNDDHMVSQENVKAIKAASKAGVKFVLATGRGYNSVRGSPLLEGRSPRTRGSACCIFRGSPLNRRRNSMSGA